MDLALGLWFGPDFKESLLLQIKLKANGMTSWLEALDTLPLLDNISPEDPNVAILLQLGPGRRADARKFRCSKLTENRNPG